MIKAKENFTYYLEGRPLQIYSGSIFSLPEGDEEYLINVGKAEAYEGGESGGGGDTSGGRVRLVARTNEESTTYLGETWESLYNWFNAGDLIMMNDEDGARTMFVCRVYDSSGGINGDYSVVTAYPASLSGRIEYQFYSCSSGNERPMLEENDN